MIRRPCIQRRLRSNRRGAITVLAALLMVAMILLVAFAVDVGMMTTRRTQHQAAADAASLAAADALYDSNGRLKLDDAITVGRDYYARNGGQGTPDVIVGRWDKDTKQFVETREQPNAVRVAAAHQYPTVFGQVANTDSFRASGEPIANTSAVPERTTTERVTIRIPIYGYTPACRRAIIGYRSETRVRTRRVPGKDGGIGLVE